MKSAQWVTGIAGAMLVFAAITAHADLANSDVTFNGANANSFVAGVPSNQSGDTTQNYANTNNLFGYNDWTFAVKDDAGGSSSESKTVSGFTFSLTAGTGNGQGSTPGTWGLNVQDADNSDSFTIPFEMDFAVYLFGGNNGAFYFFDNKTINASNAGTFQINFLNNGNPPKLSHITLLVRDMHNVENGGGGSSEVPEPASMLLFSAGLLGLGLSRRRSKLA